MRLGAGLFLKLSDLLQDLKIASLLDDLLLHEFEDINYFKTLQEKKLSGLLSYALENIPFYREFCLKNNVSTKEENVFELLKKLPVINKNDIRVNRDQFIPSKNATKKHIRMNSSGSTGEPFEYFLSRDAYSMKYAAALRGWFWMGYRLGDRYIKISQNNRTSLLKKVQDFTNNCNYIYLPNLTEKSLSEAIRQIGSVKPLYLRCYPDPLFFMAKLLAKNNKTLKGIRGINTTGNILTPEARSLIEDRFQCPVFDSYSCEGSAQFFQGPTGKNYLGSMEYALTEIINTNGEPAAPGTAGYHVTTDLWNYAMPFIRYNTQDLVVESKTLPTCGRKLFALEKIIGRDNDVLVTPDGNLLIVHLFTIYFEYFPEITAFQVEQSESNLFVFRLKTTAGKDSDTIKKIQVYWQKFLGNKCKVRIEICEEIPYLNSGKRRFLIRNPNIALPI